MNKFKLLLIYVVASILIINGFDISFLNFLLTGLILTLSIALPEISDKYFFKRKHYTIMLIVLMLFFNAALYFLTDKKDIKIIIVIEVVWLLLGTFFYIFKKFLSKNNSSFFAEIFKWYSSLVILIFLERIINSIRFFHLNLDIFHLLIAIFAWKFLEEIFKYKGFIKSK